MAGQDPDEAPGDWDIEFAAKTNSVPVVAVEFADLAREANPEVRVYLFEGWPARTGEGLLWREQVAQDLPLWLGAAGEGVEIIPAGQALALLEDEIAAGSVPGIDSLDAIFSDEIHLGGKGQYFVAMVIAGAVAGQSPEGLPAKLTRSWANRDAHLTEEQARALQRVAWAAQDLKKVKPAALKH
jgi:hypothetical protein